MHDLGDMLVHAGFADPVMDQETLTLTWADARGAAGRAARARRQCRPGALRRPAHAALARAPAAPRCGALRGADGRLALSFEIVYGHAFKRRAAAARRRRRPRSRWTTCAPWCAPAAPRRRRRPDAAALESARSVGARQPAGCALRSCHSPRDRLAEPRAPISSCMSIDVRPQPLARAGAAARSRGVALRARAAPAARRRDAPSAAVAAGAQLLVRAAAAAAASTWRCARCRWASRGVFWLAGRTGRAALRRRRAAAARRGACWSTRAMPPISETHHAGRAARCSVEHRLRPARRARRVPRRLGARRARARRRLADRAVGPGPAHRASAATCGPSCAARWRSELRAALRRERAPRRRRSKT